MPRPSLVFSAGRLALAAIRDRQRRAELEGDLLELWEHRRQMGRRDLRRAYLRDLAGVLRPRRMRRFRQGGFAMWQDIRYAARLLARTPGTTAAAIATLAIGIGASLAIYTALDRLLLRPLPYPDADRLVHVEKAPVRIGPVTGSMISRSFRELPVIAAAGAWAAGGINLQAGGESVRLSAAIVDDGFFATMGVMPALGRPLPSPDGSRLAVVSHDLWHGRLGGGAAIAGQTILLNGHSYAIVGVMPRGFTFPGRTDAWLPPNIDYQVTGSVFAPDAVARLAPGVSLEQARAAIAPYDERRRAEYNGSIEDAIQISPLGDALTSRVRSTLLLLAGSAALLMLAVCASLANLLLARVAMRDQELTVRRALGATRWRLTRQLLIESLLLSGAGAVAGALLAAWGLNALKLLAPAALDSTRVAVIDVRFALAAVGATLLTAIAFGAAPGLAAAARQSADIVRAGRQDVRSPFWRRLRSALISAQMAVALVLLITSAAAVTALVAITHVDPGFGGTRAVTMTVTLPRTTFPAAAIGPFVARARERLAAVPGVRRVGATSSLPGSLEVGVGLPVTVPGRAPVSGARPVFATYFRTTPGYFEAMGMRVMAGRTFNDGDRPGSPRVVVLSEAAARTVSPDIAGAIGQRIQIGRRNSPELHEIVGVIADVHIWGLALPKRDFPQIYVPLDADPPYGGISFVAEIDGRPADAMAGLRAAMREVDPSLPLYDVQTVDQILDRFMASHEMSGMLITSFAIVTLLVSALGLYGLMAHLVTERAREMAIRLALGAAPRGVRLRLVRHGLLHAVAGGVAGILLASAALAAFGAVLPGLTPPGPWVFVVNAAVLLASALAAVWMPASRILRLDPVTWLRQ